MKTGRVFFIVLNILSIASGARAQEPPRYEIKAAIDVVQKKIFAEQKVIYTNNSDDTLSELFFHIYPNREYSLKEKGFMGQFAGYFKVNLFPEGFQTGAIRFEEGRADGKTADLIVEGEDKTILKVSLDEPLAPGGKAEVFLKYTVEIPHAYGRFGWHEDVMRLSRWYPILSVYNEHGWNNHPFYPFHRPFFSDASMYTVELTVPHNQVVIHTGEHKDERANSDGTRVISIATDQPVREFTLAMSPHYRVYRGHYDRVYINSYYLPGQEAYGQYGLEVAKDAMRFFTERFGPYPYEEFSIAPVHLGYSGEQMSNLIFIDTRMYELPWFLRRYFDFMIAHEAGHQWFYNLVGIDEFTEMWLEEGVDSYFVSEYIDQKFGENAEVFDYPDWFKDFKFLIPELTFKRIRDVRYKTIVRWGYDHPIVGKLSSFQEPTSIFSLTYGKGSRVVGMLREQVGDAAFERAFRRMFEEYRWKNISMKEFQRLFEEESGKDLDEFFHAWLYDARAFDLAVSKVKGNKVTVVNKGEIFMPAEMKVKMRDGSEQTMKVDVARKEEYELPGKIRRVVIDPEEKLLDIDRVNNSWPRKVNVKPVPIYIPLYDVPVFLPDDGYNVVVGPEIITNGIGLKTSFQKPYDYIVYAASGYEFGEALHKSRVGFEIFNVLHSQTVFGAEASDRNDVDDDDEDLTSHKIYLRRELWPAKYGLGDINDHVSLYVLRNRGVDGLLAPGELEDSRNVSYLRRDEAIAGALFHMGRAGPALDPSQGYNLDVMAENSGHFWGATQHFTRGSVDLGLFHPVTLRSKMAYRLKGMGGFPDDKNLFQLGGPYGLRGYDRKTLRGSIAFLGSVEYRFPLIDNLRISFFDNLIGFENISGVVFFDAGQNWYSSFADSELKKNAGAGLRFTVTIGSLLEKIILRLDAATPINDPDQDDTNVWFGINHAF